MSILAEIREKEKISVEVGFGSVKIKEEQEKSLKITENGIREILPDENKVLSKLNVEVDVLGGDVEEYDGSYDVTPSIQEQTLPTTLKVMRNDITIKEIPYSEVTNTAGGKTIIIA